MKSGWKRTLTILLTLLLFVSAGPFSSLTAQAFSVRRTKPSAKDSHYYSGANPFYAGGYLNECTWYAWGRAYEALGAKPNLPFSAAHTWYRSNAGQKACPYGAKPKAGAIMITAKDSSHGHVAFVEELYDNGTMLISEYNYNVRSGFSTQVIKQLSAGEKRGRAHKVLGYIYVTKAKPADTTAPTISSCKATDKDASGFELSAKASDKTGVTAVKFQVRAEDQKWQDALWFDGVRSAKGDCWTCQIPTSAFNDFCGAYIARCCAYDEAGNKTTKDVAVSLAEYRQTPASSDPNAPAGTETAGSAAELNGLAPVLFPAWITEQADTGTSAEGDLWERRFPTSENTAWEPGAAAPADIGSFDLTLNSARSLLGL